MTSRPPENLPVYLDYQATTPLAPEAWEAMVPWLRDKFANPHSAHRLGREARAAVEVARDAVTALMPHGGRTIFTSGATEALNLAILGGLPSNANRRRNRIVTLATEHSAVLDTVRQAEASGFALTILPVGRDGLVDLNVAEAAMGDDVALVAAMLVNNEIGVIQPARELAAMAHQAGALFLCDAVQGFGRVPLPEADLIAVSSHKIYGPKGIGALWMQDGIAPRPILHGGGQEGGLRSGTLSPALCVGFGAAAQIAQKLHEQDGAHIGRLWAIAKEQMTGWHLNGSDDPEARYRANMSLRREDIDAARLLSDVRDVAFSLGSACASGSGRPSHVLTALGLTPAEAKSSIRLGWGRYTDATDLAYALDCLNQAAAAQVNG